MLSLLCCNGIHAPPVTAFFLLLFFFCKTPQHLMKLSTWDPPTRHQVHLRKQQLKYVRAAVLFTCFRKHIGNSQFELTHPEVFIAGVPRWRLGPLVAPVAVKGELAVVLSESLLILRWLVKFSSGLLLREPDRAWSDEKQRKGKKKANLWKPLSFASQDSACHSTPRQEPQDGISAGQWDLGSLGHLARRTNPKSAL